MKEFSVLMALADFLPVALFAAASVILQRELHAKMSKGAFALFAAGTIDVIFAGAFKALYKLLYALRLCDFEKLNAVFFPMQSVGFLLAGIGILALLTHRQSGSALAAAAPPAFSGTFLFVGAMVLGLGMMDAGLCVISAKMKKRPLILLFLLSFLCSLCMGYLSSRDFTGAAMNWIAEGVNILGQGAFFAGTLLLCRGGLSSLPLRGEKDG